MAEEDQHFKKLEINRQKRKYAEFKRKVKAKQIIENANKTFAEMTDDEEESTTADETDDEIEVSGYHRKRATATSASTLKSIASSDNDTSQTSVSNTGKITPHINRWCLIDNPLFVAGLDRTGTIHLARQCI